jgi:hypothetical protein
MLYHQNINPYKVTVKLYKNINQLVYSVGFPVASFNPTSLGNNIQQVKSENKIVITNCTFKTIPNFNTWKINFKPSSKKNSVELPDLLPTNYEMLKQKILAIQLMHNTPLQVMLQLGKLQMELS